jgi:hypothetical protein
MPLPNEGIDWDGLASQFPVERPQGAEFFDISKAFGAGVGEGTAALGRGHGVFNTFNNCFHQCAFITI